MGNLVENFVRTRKSGSFELDGDRDLRIRKPNEKNGDRTKSKERD